MNCKKCGFILTNENATCPNCGEVNEFYNGGINAAPVQPAAPATPVAPTAPAEPVQPVQPVEPVAPVQPVEPVQPVQPVQPAAPVEPVAPVAPVQPTPVAPVQPVAPVTPVAPAPEAAPINTMTSAPVAPAQNKKSNIGFIIIVIVLSLAIIGLGIFVASKLLGNNNSNGGNKTVQNDTPSNDNNNNNDNNDTPTQVSDEDTFQIAGVTFTLPSGYIYSEDENGGYVKGTSYLLQISGISDYGYTTEKEYLEQDLNAYLPQLESKGLSYLESKETTVGGLKYYYAEFYDTAMGANIAFTVAELPDGLVFGGSIVYLPSAKDDAFKITSTILKTEKTGSSSFAPSENIDPFAAPTRTLE